MKQCESELQLYRAPFRIGCFLMRNDPTAHSAAICLVLGFHCCGILGSGTNRGIKSEPECGLSFLFEVWVLSLEL